jgi:predicted MFS family arabinose efflux permease
MAHDEPMAARAYTLAILTAIFTVSIMDRQILSVLFEPLKQEFDLSDAQLGLLSGPAFVLFYTTLGIPLAMYADRGHRARIIRISLVVFSFMTALCGMATTFPQLLLARIGVAIGEAGTNPPSHSIIADLYPPAERTSAMGWFALGPHFGLLLGLFMGAWVGQWYGWRVALWTAGAMGLALSVLVRTALKEPPSPPRVKKPLAETASLREGVRFIWSHPALRHLFIGGSLLAFVTNGVIVWLPSFLIRSHGFSTGQAGTAAAFMMGILGGAGTVIGARLTNRLAIRDPRWKAWAPALGAVPVLCFLVAGVLTDDRMVMLACLGIASVGIVWFFPPTFALVQDLVDSRMRALAAALLLFVGSVIGMGLGPQLIGLLSDALGARHGADALRHALLLVVPIGLWGAYHYTLAARALAPAPAGDRAPIAASAGSPQS